MNARILPPEEWDKLSVTGLLTIGQTVRPEDIQIVVVEDGERIVSTMAVLRVTHFESLWIDPEYADIARGSVRAVVIGAGRAIGSAARASASAVCGRCRRLPRRVCARSALGDIAATIAARTADPIN